MINECNGIEREKFLAAMAIVSNKDTWTQGDLARSSSGAGCSYNHYLACKFCSVGALYKAGTSSCIHFSSDFCIKFYNKTLATLNDNNAHHQVIEIWHHYLAYCDQNNLWKSN